MELDTKLFTHTQELWGKILFSLSAISTELLKEGELF